MAHFLKRPRVVNPMAPNLYSYHLGMEYHADAEEMVFNRMFTDPVVTFVGAGKIAGGLRVMQSPQVVFQRQTIKTGIPTIAGQFALQPLIGNDNG